MHALGTLEALRVKSNVGKQLAPMVEAARGRVTAAIAVAWA